MFKMFCWSLTMFLVASLAYNSGKSDGLMIAHDHEHPCQCDTCCDYWFTFYRENIDE